MRGARTEKRTKNEPRPAFKCVFFFFFVVMRSKSDQFIYIKVQLLSDDTPTSHSTRLHPLLPLRHFPSRADVSSPCGSVLRLSSTLSIFLPLSAASLAGRGWCCGGGGGAFSPTTAFFLSFFVRLFCCRLTCVSFCPQRRLCVAWMCGNSAGGRGLSEWMEIHSRRVLSLLTAVLSCGETRSAVRASQQ